KAGELITPSLDEYYNWLISSPETGGLGLSSAEAQAKVEKLLKSKVNDPIKEESKGKSKSVPWLGITDDPDDIDNRDMFGGVVGSEYPAAEFKDFSFNRYYTWLTMPINKGGKGKTHKEAEKIINKLKKLKSIKEHKDE